MVKDPVSSLHPRPSPLRSRPGPVPLKPARCAPVKVRGERVCPLGASISRSHQSPLYPVTEILIPPGPPSADNASLLLVEYDHDLPWLMKSPESPLKLKEPVVTVCARAAPATSRPPTAAVSDR